MSRNKNFLSSFLWIFDVSRRFASVDRKGRTAATGFLSVLGISIGVMSLIAVISVMNGFQRSFIDAIMELSSYHVRVSSLPEEKKYDFIEFCVNNRDILSVSPFYESQGLIVGSRGKESAGIIRGVDSNVCSTDGGFAREIKIVSGKFDLSMPDNIVVGAYLAQKLGVRAGDTVNLLALSGGSDVSLLSNDRRFTVAGIFECGYYDINDGYCYVSLEAARKYFGSRQDVVYGIKIRRENDDGRVISRIKSEFPDSVAKSWREYNRAFFGALRIEKNILMMLVFLIFVVVAVNIYNGMRRLVFERSQEISVLSALGGTSAQIKAVFILRGLMTGLLGSVSGLIAGIFISMNIRSVFLGISHIMYWGQYIFFSVFLPQHAAFVTENQMYSIYASIPARIVLSEVVMISLFGILSPLAASCGASHNILRMKIAEVLHDE